MALPMLTQADAQQRLQTDGLESMGLAALILGRQWSGTAVTVDTDALTWSIAGAGPLIAPYRGIRRHVEELGPEGLWDVSGAPLTGPGVRFDLHPQAALRLETMVAQLLPGAAAGATRPVPVSLVVQGTLGTATTARWFVPGGASVLTTTPLTCSFHDRLGLPVCPVATAALFQALLVQFPGLDPSGSPAATGDGRLATIATAATGIAVQVVDLHGAPFVPVGSETVGVVDGAGVVLRPLGTNAVVSLAASGESIGLVAPGAPPRVRLGWSRNTVLGTAALSAPTLAGGVTLPRQFLRAVAVDLPFHLLGNRAAGAVQGIPADDQRTPVEFLPPVRDGVNVDLLADGVDVLGAVNGLLADFTAAGGGMVFAASPVIENGMELPPRPGPVSPDPAIHWPVFPQAPTPATTSSGAPPDEDLTAVWSGDQDIVLTLAGGRVASGASVRVYSQVFVPVPSIGPEPSFLRGDGAATVVQDASPVSLLLRNPLGLAAGVVRPAGAQLIFDLVVTQRDGSRRMFANVSVVIGDGVPAVPPVDLFAVPAPLDGLDLAVKGVSPSPVFGIPAPPPPPGGTPSSLGDLLRRLAGESRPRSAPRLPTMARFPTLVVAGRGNPSNQLAWSAVVTGGRLARETRSAKHALGNPGNPAGPDVHAAGVRLDGTLAFDAAGIALKRAQPIVPFDTADSVHGWIPFVGSNAWDDTQVVAPAPTATCAGAVLHTVAVGVETPELLPNVLQPPAPGASAQDLVNDLANLLGVPPPGFALVNDDQILREVRREFHHARQGSRDALWSLRRAIGQARRFVLVAGPHFGPTAYVPEGETPAVHELDLVQVLVDQLAAQASLRVVIATPRLPDHSPAYGGWVRQALAARAEAVERLRDAAGDRVVAFHPVGFPGRDVRIRTTSVVVDDVWAMVGTSHWRRRGLTFDQGVDVVTLDRTMDATGVSARVRAFRRGLLASLLSVPVPAVPAVPDPEWVRLATGISMAELAGDLLDQGGLGRVLPFWEGPTDNDVLAGNPNLVDPDGSTSDQYLALFASLIGESA